MYINGKWIETDQKLKVKNPANGELVQSVSLVGKEETKDAIKAAKSAFRKWAGLTGDQRSAYLSKVVEKLEEKQEVLARRLQKKWEKIFIMHAMKFAVQSVFLNGMPKNHGAYTEMLFQGQLHTKGPPPSNNRLGLLVRLHRGISHYR